MSEDFALGEVEVSQTPLARFEEYLQSKGMRMTQQRRTLVEQVFAQHHHFDADQLLAELAKDGSQRKVSRPTVYRTLGELVESGLLRKMDLGGRAVYEHDYGYPQHDHLYCEQCHRLIEFHSKEIQEIRDDVGQQHRFRVSGHRLIISGICEDCQRKRLRRKSPLDLI